MSASKAKAARKAADPDGYFKEPKRPTQAYKTKRERQEERSFDRDFDQAMHDVIVRGLGAEEGKR
jgi:hypothetical protein